MPSPLLTHPFVMLDLRALSLSHTHVHTSNTAKSKSAANDSDPRYLGEICRIEDYMMYVARGREVYWCVCGEFTIGTHSFTRTPPPPSLPPSLSLLPSRSFGFMTGTNVTLILACKRVSSDQSWIKKLFGVLYNDYLHAVCNPFAKVGSPINSPAFEKRVEDACKRAARLAVAP